MKWLVLFALLIVQGNEIKWHEVNSLSCAQLKVQGKGKNNVAFGVYKAANRGAKCCDLGAIVFRGRTHQFGYFDVPTRLEVHGNYYFVFEYKGARLTIPIEMKNNYQDKQCEAKDQIIDFDKFGRPEMTLILTVE